MVDVTSRFALEVAGTAAEALAVALLLGTVRPDAADVGGRRVLAYGRPLKVLVAVLWAGWGGLLIAALSARPDDRPAAAALVGGFLLAIIGLHLETFGVRISFDGDGIRTRSPWRRGRQIPWAAVERTWYAQAMQWHVVQTRGFGRVRLSDFLSGTGSLMAELLARGVPVARQPANPAGHPRRRARRRFVAARRT